jgi:hypothetical protein
MYRIGDFQKYGKDMMSDVGCRMSLRDKGNDSVFVRSKKCRSSRMLTRCQSPVERNSIGQVVQFEGGVIVPGSLQFEDLEMKLRSCLGS